MNKKVKFYFLNILFIISAASQAYSIKQQAHIDAKWRQFQNKSNERNGSDDDKNDDDDDQLNASQSNLMNEAMKNKNFDL